MASKNWQRTSRRKRFGRAFESLDSCRPELKFSAWIFRIANHLGVDHLRRKALETVALENTPDVTPSGRIMLNRIQLANRAGASPSPTPTLRVKARALAPAMEQVIQRLRKEYRRCFILRYVEERSYDVNADILDLLVGTVKSHTHRAKKELKRMPSPAARRPADGFSLHASLRPAAGRASRSCRCGAP